MYVEVSEVPSRIWPQVSFKALACARRARLAAFVTRSRKRNPGKLSTPGVVPPVLVELSAIS